MEQAIQFWRSLKERVEQASMGTRVLSVFAVAALVIVAALWIGFIAPPSAFPTDRLIEVPEGVAASELAELLEREQVIRSSFVLHAWMRLSGVDRNIHAGTYYFAKPLSLLMVADRIKEGERGIESIRVTLTEGMNAREMGRALAAVLPSFDEDVFVALGGPFEGYLFPDTYFVDPGTAPQKMVERMQANFDERTRELREHAADRGISFEEVLIMASLIEKEADTAEDRRIVSGILWNRIEEDMPLQVDAVFGYILGRSGYAPTGDDLDIDSPYNTYRHRGLPPSPIANPGLDAIDAALNPAKTDYFYYLTGRDGLMYYATTFEEHKRNRERYLD